MATLFRSLVSASEAVEMAVSRDAEPRTYALSAHRELGDVLVVHADRCCQGAGDVLGYYTARQAKKMLASDDDLITACSCVLTAAAIVLAA
jgi:hypothetical protein